jgi:hypothetical protein
MGFAEYRGGYLCSKTGCFIDYTSYSFRIWIKTMASIGQGVVGEAHCISLVEVAAEQMLEPIDIVPALQRGWAWWCAGAALNVGNMIVI